MTHGPHKSLITLQVPYVLYGQGVIHARGCGRGVRGKECFFWQGKDKGRGSVVNFLCTDKRDQRMALLQQLPTRYTAGITASRGVNIAISRSQISPLLAELKEESYPVLLAAQGSGYDPSPFA